MRAALVRRPLRALIFPSLLLAIALPSAKACAPIVERSADGHTVRLRATDAAGTRCPVSEAEYQATVRAWWAAWPADLPAPTSLGLGRAVDYPWLSRQIADLALASPGWRKRAAKARPGELDRLAAPVLHAPGLLRQLSRPFDGAPLAVTGLSFEKVLFGPASGHATATAERVPVPFDAQLWLRLAPRQANR